MSIVFNLYKVENDVEYTGCFLDNLNITAESIEDLSDKEIENLKAFGYNPSEPSSFGEAMFNACKSSFSDGKDHDMIQFNLIKSVFKTPKGKQQREWKPVCTKLQNFNLKTFKDKHSTIIKYIVCTPVQYAQGWFLKKRFFKRRSWRFYATTKKQMNNFFDRYGNKSEQCYEVRKLFNEKWEDGMLFECSW